MGRLGKRATGESHRQKQVFVPGGHLGTMVVAPEEPHGAKEADLILTAHPVGSERRRHSPTTGLVTNFILATKTGREEKSKASCCMVPLTDRA